MTETDTLVRELLELSERYRGGFTREYKDAIKSLDGPTPCAASDKPDDWPAPRSQRVFKQAAKRCKTECPILAQCLALGQANGESGIYGGQLLRNGVPVPFESRSDTRQRGGFIKYDVGETAGARVRVPA